MRDTETVLNTFETDAHEAAAVARPEHHDNNQRPRSRGDHGSAPASPPRSR